MALYMVYRKATETETEVIYHFGSSETELDRGLVIQKAGSAVRAVEGTTDPLLMKVAARILARKGTDQTWPGGGGIQA